MQLRRRARSAVMTIEGCRQMKLTIGKRITLGFATTVAITDALGTFSLYELRSVRADSDEVTQKSMPGVTRSLQMQNCIALNNGGMFKQLFARRPEDKAAVDKEMKATTAYLTGL